MSSVTHPRVTLVPDPTPLVRLRQLSQHLGIDLWIKRDDLAGPSIGGNKARQLEYYLGAAQAIGADTILITGAVQSNFVRIAAAAARSLGLHPIVQLEERVAKSDPHYQTSGNVLLSALLGAEVIRYPEGEDEAGADRALYAKAEELRAAGRVPYVIPLGEDHPPLGALGYVDAAQEILAQQGEFDIYVVASGSGATHTGLLAGLRGAGAAGQVIGACVRRSADLQEPRILRLVQRLSELYSGACEVLPQDIVVWDGALAPGYGEIGATAKAAIDSMGQQEGLILDPVYTAKAFAAIPALVTAGKIKPGARVCFVHTGGLAAVFAYMNDVLAP